MPITLPMLQMKANKISLKRIFVVVRAGFIGDGWTHELRDGRKDRRKGKTDGRTNKATDGQMERLKDKLSDRRTDE